MAMPFLSQRPPSGLLHAVRIAGDAKQTRTNCWFINIEHTVPAIEACCARFALHRIFEFLSARPWHRALYNLARDAAQEPAADGASLRRSLERVVVLAAAGREPEVHAFALAELGASYSIIR